MSSLRAAVITFPGSNCDDDCVYTLEKICEFKVDTLWHKDTPDLSVYQLVLLPGGFSYGDYLRSGAMAALSPIMEKVKEFAAGGGYVLAICNGFQIACEAGLLPGALAKNDSLKFICRDVTLTVENTENPWLRECKKGDKLVWPIAHGDGRYVIEEEKIKSLEANGQILLRYVDNPNGSVGNIAGVCNEKKNVFGFMPHPERASDLRSQDGMKLWKSLLSSLRGQG